ncbi:hypothetical protein CKA38_09655 [Ereboglobus luteus]|uniref:Alpha-L-rhamnosidase six-hairpin glycosidase domain-containing protein n=2 Tax=Ereboglobus luteus TaxID=1796921 RepID=A0A2U8E7N6_9BACT|nr:hypothetical protein CKA38_09655 [Ereboglobus luteus]
MHMLKSPAAGLAMLAFACVALATSTQPVRAAEATLLVEPETFIALDSWQRVRDHIQSGNQPGTAFAGVNITQPGSYHVWTRTQNFINNQSGKRRLLIKIDGERAARESGAHTADGWAWEHVGEMKLDAGLRMIEIVDTARNYGRLEAILLTTTAIDPNTRPRNSFNSVRTPVVQPGRVFTAHAPQPSAPDANSRTLAELKNKTATIVFRATQTAGGENRVWREVRCKNAKGQPLTIDAGAEPLFLLSSEKNTASFNAFYPVWKTDAQVDWRLGGHVMRRAADLRDPYVAGAIARFDPVSARQLANGKVEVTYQSDSGAPGTPATIRAIWSLPADGFAARVEVSHEVGKDAWYSFAFSCGQSVPREEVAAVMLPPVYQFRRIPEGPEMITSSITPHPYALIEAKARAESPAITRGIVAAPDFLDTAWPGRTNARFGFTLLAPNGEAQPWSFSPILGADGSQLKRGDTLRAAWHVVMAPQSWEQVMRDADTRLYGVTDYREPVTTSITDQALNIIDLIADDKAGGWDARLKGPENIESPSTVTHAAPLIYLSSALLTKDEDFYWKRALPTIEYLLSRPSAHFATKPKNNSYVTTNSSRIGFRNLFYGSVVWQGVDDLTRRLNPWLDSYIRDAENRPFKPANSGTETDWSGWLALYRQKPDAALLKRIQANADGWITRAFETNPNLASPIGIQPFYNVSYYPCWWDLLDLHELTGEQRYVDAARRGAAHTIAGLWVAPQPAGGNTTLYPNNKYVCNHTIWWKGDASYRLGWPDGLKPHARATVTFDLPEKQVPAWVVSPVGLGLEQPTTYFNACTNGMSNIMLSVWAANLLRLYGETGDEYYRTFARNTIIGRGANYPGYYLSGFTDIMQNADYPRTGPDITSFYWHHAPVHLAMLVDYLVTDADVRTKGAIRFPYSKQQGYVWFTSRIYGGRPGRVFDDAECRLWLDREKFRVDNPKLDYFGARGKTKFHLVILNQARGAETAAVTIDRNAIGIPIGKKPFLRIIGNPNAKTKPRLTANKQGQYTVTLPARGIAVITFDANEEAAPAIPALQTKPVTTKLEKPWGEMRAFRIRSPFGRDSLYVALAAQPPAGSIATIEIETDGAAPVTQTLDAFPYEFSLPGIAMDKSVRFRLELTAPGQPTTTTRWFVMD